MMISVPNYQSRRVGLPQDGGVSQAILDDVFFPIGRRIWESFFHMGGFGLVIPICKGLGDVRGVIRIVLYVKMVIYTIQAIFLRFQVRRIPPSINFLGCGKGMRVVRLWSSGVRTFFRGETWGRCREGRVPWVRREEGGLARLFVPVYLRALLCVLSKVISALVLSSMGSRTIKTIKATGACVKVFVVVFSIVSSKVMTIVARGVKTNEPKITCRTERLKLTFGTILNVVVSLFLSLNTKAVLSKINITSTLVRPTGACLRVINKFYVLGTLVPVYSDCLQTFKFSGRPLCTSVAKGIVGFYLGTFFLFMLRGKMTNITATAIVSHVVGLIVIMLLNTILMGTGRRPRERDGQRIVKRVVHVKLPSTYRATVCGISVALIVHFLGRVSTRKLGIATHSCAVRVAGFSCYINTTLTRTGTVVAK